MGMSEPRGLQSVRPWRAGLQLEVFSVHRDGGALVGAWLVGRDPRDLRRLGVCSWESPAEFMEGRFGDSRWPRPCWETVVSGF